MANNNYRYLPTTVYVVMKYIAISLYELLTKFQILQIVAVVGGGLVIGLFPDSANSIVMGIGGVSIGVGSVVLFYEIIMIIFVFVEKANHPARLLVVSLYSYTVLTL